MLLTFIGMYMSQKIYAYFSFAADGKKLLNNVNCFNSVYLHLVSAFSQWNSEKKKVILDLSTYKLTQWHISGEDEMWSETPICSVAF